MIIIQVGTGYGCLVGLIASISTCDSEVKADFVVSFGEVVILILEELTYFVPE